jgi:hypothetical protein
MLKTCRLSVAIKSASECCGFVEGDGREVERCPFVGLRIGGGLIGKIGCPSVSLT